MSDKDKTCFLCQGAGQVRAIVAKTSTKYAEWGAKPPADAWKMYPCPLCNKSKGKQ